MIDWLLSPSRVAHCALLPLGGGAAVGRRAPVPPAPGLARWRQALAATGLARVVDSPGPLSLLAPTDRAFEELLVEWDTDWPDLCADLPRLRTLLLGHLLPQRLPARGLKPGIRLATLGPSWVGVEAGESGRLTLRDTNGRQACLHTPDLQAGAGAACVHAIDRVLLPPQRSLLEQLASQPELSEFLSALRHCGLDGLLRAGGPLTLFAPRNAGFVRLAARLGLRRSALWQSPERLRQILLHHLVSGHWPGHELPWGGCLRSAEGSPLRLGVLGLIGEGDSAQALPSGFEQLASNGVLHLIDQALLPDSCNPPSSTPH